MRAVRSRFVWRLALATLVLLGLAVAQVWLRLQVVNVGYELSNVRRMTARLEHDRNQLRLELATLRDPGRLAERAQKRLGLQAPERGRVVEVR